MKIMELFTKSMPYGIMTWWSKVPDAARYMLHLKIGTKDYDVTRTPWAQPGQRDVYYYELESLEISRNKFYHTFSNLAAIHRDLGFRYNEQTDTWKYYDSWAGYTKTNYYVFVEAEDREGNVIARSETEICLVEVIK